jgi:hypothetical protein
VEHLLEFLQDFLEVDLLEVCYLFQLLEHLLHLNLLVLL